MALALAAAPAAAAVALAAAAAGVALAARAAGAVDGHAAVGQPPGGRVVALAQRHQLLVVHVEGRGGGAGAGGAVQEQPHALRPAAAAGAGGGGGGGRVVEEGRRRRERAVLQAVHLVRGTRRGAVGPPGREAHRAHGPRPGLPRGRAAAEDLLVGVAELAAEGHVDDEVDGGVEGLQEVGDQRQGLVQVALGAQARVVGGDARHDGVDGAGQRADQEDPGDGQQHHGDAVLLVADALPAPAPAPAPAHSPRAAAAAHVPPQRPRAADGDGDEGVDDDEDDQRDEAEEDVEGQPVGHHEALVAAQGGQLQLGEGQVAGGAHVHHLVLQGGGQEGQRRQQVDGGGGQQRAPPAVDGLGLDGQVDGDAALHAQHGGQPGGDAGAHDAAVGAQHRVGAAARAQGAQRVPQPVDAEGGEGERVEEEEQVRDGQRRQAHVGGRAHAVLHQHHQAEHVAHHPEDGEHGDEHHAEDEGHFVQRGLRHQLLHHGLQLDRRRHVRGVVAEAAGAAAAATARGPGGGGGAEEVGVVHGVGDAFLLHQKYHGHHCIQSCTEMASSVVFRVCVCVWFCLPRHSFALEKSTPAVSFATCTGS